MHGICVIDDNGVEPRPTYEDLSKFVVLPCQFACQICDLLLDSPPLPIQLDGIGITEFEEVDRREIIKRHKEYMVRQIATDIGTSAQLLRALKQRTCNSPTESLVDSSNQDVDELIAGQIHDLEEEQRR